MASESVPHSVVPPPGGHPLAPVPYVVRARKPETADTFTLALAPASSAAVARFRPGQFVMLYVFGVGEAPIGCAGDPSHENELVHTIRTAGKTTAALARLSPGETVGVRGPYGHGWPMGEARGRDLVIVAGGLGLPPLRPALYEVLAHRGEFGRVEVIYGARTPRDLVYYDEIQTWRRRTDLRFQTTVDTAGRDWYGDVGVVTTRIPDTRFEPGRTTAFICGPEIMLKLTSQELVDRGVSSESIWVSMERNMKCAIGLCGHCQFGPSFICRDGPVLRYRELEPLLGVREV